MNKSLIAGAMLLAGAAFAVPVTGWSADEAPPPAATPAQPSGGQAGGGQWGGGHSGGMGMRGPMWMHRMGGMGMRATPQQRCEQHLAHRAAHVAYITSLLNLTPEQRPLYEKVRTAMQAAADKQHQLCGTLKPASERGQETVLDRLDQREQFLSARLQAVQQTKPALQALYQALTPEQKAIVDHPMYRR